MTAEEARRLEYGDVVRGERWGIDVATVGTINSAIFPDDPVVFFVEGGFWRSSQLELVKKAGA